jgi:signal transduction histidine kinase
VRIPIKTRTLQIVLVLLLAASIALLVYWILGEKPYSGSIFVWESAVLSLALLSGMILLNRTVRHAAERRQRQRSFLGAVSHEFKTPLAGMRLSVETLALRDPPAEKRQQLVSRLLDELDRLETMVSHLLDTTHIEAGSVICHPERMPLERVIGASLRGVEDRARRSGVALEADVPRDIEIVADPSAVRAIVDNLVDNAVRACGGREDGRVRVTASSRGSSVEMIVADNGIGFPPDEAGKLFERFYRVERGARPPGGGSGLGLYIVRHLAKLNNVSVTAKSAGEGKGAAFTVAWPAAGEERS